MRLSTRSAGEFIHGLVCEGKLEQAIERLAELPKETEAILYKDVGGMTIFHRALRACNSELVKGLLALEVESREDDELSIADAVTYPTRAPGCVRCYGDISLHL